MKRWRMLMSLGIFAAVIALSVILLTSCNDKKSSDLKLEKWEEVDKQIITPNFGHLDNCVEFYFDHKIVDCFVTSMTNDIYAWSSLPDNHKVIDFFYGQTEVPEENLIMFIDEFNYINFVGFKYDPSGAFEITDFGSK